MNMLDMPEEKMANRNDLSNNENKKTISFFRLFEYATTLDKVCMLLGTLLSLASGILLPLSALQFGDVTQSLINYGSQFNKSLPEDKKMILKNILKNDVTNYCIILALYGLVILTTTYLATVLFNHSALRQILKIREAFLKKTLSQDIEWFDLNQTGDFATTFTQNIFLIEEGIGDKISSFLFFEAIFVESSILVFIKGWKLALICMISFPLAAIITIIISIIITKFSQQEMEAYGKAGAVAEEALSYIKTVIAFEGQEKEISRYDTHLVHAQNNNIRRGIFNSISEGLLFFIMYACFGLSFWFGVNLILEDRHLPMEKRVYTAGNMMTIFFCGLQASINFSLGLNIIETIAASIGAAQKIFAILDSEPVIRKHRSSGINLEQILGPITFNNVFFNYPSRPDVQILQGLTLQINKGETIALVGSSGCGKSTCVQLLQRFYDPLKGNITIDGIDLRDLNLNWLRKSIAVVSQEPSLFGITIFENIRYGKLSASKEEIKSAATKANAHIFIKNLPKGYETVLGERGTQLSGGQKQRIAIARALVKKPEILLLDEATSALDTTSESEVQAALDSVRGLCTTIIVAHRLSTIRNANRIVVIKSGKVLEIGTHNNLLSKKGEYWNLVTSQAFSETEIEEEKKNDSKIEKKLSVVSFISDEKRISEEIAFEQQLSTSILWKVLKINKDSWHFTLLGCISATLAGLPLPFYGVALGGIFGVLSEDDDTKILHDRNTYCLMFFAIAITLGLCKFLQKFAFCVSSEKLTLKIRSLLFAAMLKQEMGWFDRKENGIGALCSRLAGDAVSVQGTAGMQMGAVINVISTLFFTCIIAFYYEWSTSLVLLSLCPVGFLALFAEQKLLRQDAAKNLKMLERSANLAVEAIGSIRTVVSLGCEQIFQDAFVRELMSYDSIARKRSHIRGLVFGITRSFLHFSYVAGITYGVHFVTTNEVPYQSMFTAIQVLITGTWTAGNSMSIAPNFQKSFLAASRIINFLERVPLIRNNENPVNIQWENETVDCSQVQFSYPTRPSISVLNGINLEVLKGKTVALVGPSGCGKSTVIQLLERFYDPNSGQISINKTNTKFMDLTTLRSQLGIVSQEPNLFDITIAENISYGGNYNKAVNRNDIIEAAKNANIHNFITTLPMGYESRLGSKGTQLSGGQKQRIAIARALLRNPKILLLDEATSALDNESERIVQEALVKASKNRTCITIAHRLTSIQDADIICVFKKGTIVEMGTHKELLNKKGLYYEFYML